LLDFRSDGIGRVDLARKLEESGEREAAAFLRREAVRRAASPEELVQVQRALVGDESYPAGTFKKRYRAAAGDAERLRVVQQFLTLAPHDSALLRRQLALLDGLGRKPALVQEVRRIETDPFADAALLADAAALLRKSGDELEARRIFGELVERAPTDPWVRAFVGDRLRNEGWFDDATRVYSVLEELAPDHPAAVMRLALAHQGAGRVDIARRLLARIAQTGGRAGDGQLGKLARSLAAVLLADARALAGLTPQQTEQLEQAALQIGDGRRDSILLVRTPAATAPVKVTLLRGPHAARVERTPDVAAAGIGLFLFLVEPGDPQPLTLRLARPPELAPAPPLRARIDAIREPMPGRLPSREIELPLDGKPVEVPVLAASPP
jgi:tetratricopeptide (TPR) repeat protein